MSNEDLFKQIITLPSGLTYPTNNIVIDKVMLLTQETQDPHGMILNVYSHLVLMWNEDLCKNLTLPSGLTYLTNNIVIKIVIFIDPL